MNLIAPAVNCINKPGANLVSVIRGMGSALLLLGGGAFCIALGILVLAMRAPFLAIGFLLQFCDWCAKPLTRDDTGAP